MSWLLRIDAPRSSVEVATTELWDLDTTGVAELPSSEDRVELVAGFEQHDAAQRASAALAGMTDLGLTTGRIDPVDPAGWEAPAPVTIEVASRSLHIEVGHAFGHGAHPTTALALAALDRLIRPGLSVLDVGTGTGILALAAAALGADPVTAIDIDPVARNQASANASTNGIELDLRSDDITDVGGRYGLVVANMLLADLLPIADDVATRVAPDGLLFVTGSLDEQAERAAAAFADLTPVRSDHRDGWVGLTLQRSPNSTEEAP